jgi:hypothetical protein
MIMKPTGTIGMPIGLMVPILSQEYMLPLPFGTPAENECLSLAQIGLNPERADHILSSTQNTHPTYRAGGIIWYSG